MTSVIDLKQQKHIALIGIALSSIGVLIAILVYLDGKKHAKVKEETARLDREIKLLELALKKDEAKSSGLI